jgi:ribosomal protein S1
MDKKKLTGTITFIHHEKKYATIEYLVNGKKKNINGSVDEKVQLKLRESKTIKKMHSFKIGDEVSFLIVPSAKGDRMIADELEFMYNNAFSNLLNKALIENKFTGYLKKTDDDYFIKEAGSYILFPLVLSPWERVPHESRINEPVFFKLNNLDKPNNLTASFYQSEYIPEYSAAVRHFRNKLPAEGTVFKVSPHGIFINLFNNKIQAKIPVQKNNTVHTDEPEVKIGDTINVIITYLSPLKIAVERATAD